MEQEKKKTKFGMIVAGFSILFLAVGLGSGYAISKVVNGLKPEEKKLIDEYRLLKEDWLYGNESQYLADLAAKGLISNVASDKNDPYTFYTSTTAEQGLSTDGKGFGFLSHYYDGGLYVSEVYTDSTSYQAGLREGDVLMSLKIDDGETYLFQEHSLSEINQKLSSATSDDSTYLFEGYRKEKKVSFSLKRGFYSENLINIIEKPSSENGKTMVLKVNTFLGNPTSALDGCLRESYSENQIQTLVLDLRGNGGGYVSQACEMAELFVKKGTLIYQLRDKNDRVVEEETQTKDPKYVIPDFKIILDHNTASASEIFTLAMLKGTECKTYGLTSYGKGIAQSFKTFSDGSVIRYTYAKVYGPDKNGENPICIHGVGIQPDVAFTFDYSFLSSAMDFSSIGISESGQNHFLEVLNCLYPGAYPSSYSQTYHFPTAIEQYAASLFEKYGEEDLQIAFNEKGGMAKRVNDILNKESYDAYLSYYRQGYQKVMEN